MDNHYNSIYDTCKFRHRCALWQAMEIYKENIVKPKVKAALESYEKYMRFIALVKKRRGVNSKIKK